MSHPISHQGFDHIVLRTTDKAAMLAFYVDVLGASIDRDRPELSLTHLRVGPDLIDIVVRESPPGPAEVHNLDHFCLRVQPFDEAAIRAHLAAHGVEIVQAGERYGAAGEGPSLYIVDPEGNTVELKGQP